MTVLLPQQERKLSPVSIGVENADEALRLELEMVAHMVREADRLTCESERAQEIAAQEKQQLEQALHPTAEPSSPNHQFSICRLYSTHSYSALTVLGQDRFRSLARSRWYAGQAAVESLVEEAVNAVTG